MSKIYNTIFNGFFGSDQFQKHKINNINNGTTNFMLIGNNSSFQLSINLFEKILNFGSRFNVGFPLFIGETPSSSQTILFGNDNLQYAQYITNVFGLTNEIPGTTNTSKITFSYNQAPFYTPFTPTHDILFGSNSNTYNYVSFKNLDTSSSNKLYLNKLANSNSQVTINVVATYTPTGQLQKVQFENNLF